MIFVLETILITFDAAGRRQTSYVLQGPVQEKVLISTVTGSAHQYDLARSSNLREEYADLLFKTFMHTFDELKTKGQKLHLGQIFIVDVVANITPAA